MQIALITFKRKNIVRFLIHNNLLYYLLLTTHCIYGYYATLYLTDAQDGYRITPMDPSFAEQMESAEAIMREDRNVLRELANR